MIFILTGEGVVSLVGVEGSRGGEHDGGVQVADDAGNGVGGVLQRVSAGVGSVQRGEDVGTLIKPKD